MQWRDSPEKLPDLLFSPLGINSHHSHYPPLNRELFMHCPNCAHSKIRPKLSAPSYFSVWCCPERALFDFLNHKTSPTGTGSFILHEALRGPHVSWGLVARRHTEELRVEWLTRHEWASRSPAREAVRSESSNAEPDPESDKLKWALRCMCGRLGTDP